MALSGVGLFSHVSVISIKSKYEEIMKRRTHRISRSMERASNNGSEQFPGEHFSLNDVMVGETRFHFAEDLEGNH